MLHLKMYYNLCSILPAMPWNIQSDILLFTKYTIIWIGIAAMGVKQDIFVAIVLHLTYSGLPKREKKAQLYQTNYKSNKLLLTTNVKPPLKTFFHIVFDPPNLHNF